MNAHLSLCAMVLHAVDKKRTVCILSDKTARELIMKKRSSMPRAGLPLLPSLSPFFLPFLILSVSSLLLFMVLVTVLSLYFSSWGTEASEGREWSQRGEEQKESGLGIRDKFYSNLFDFQLTLGCFQGPLRHLREIFK